MWLCVAAHFLRCLQKIYLVNNLNFAHLFRNMQWTWLMQNSALIWPSGLDFLAQTHTHTDTPRHTSVGGKEKGNMRKHNDKVLPLPVARWQELCGIRQFVCRALLLSWQSPSLWLNRTPSSGESQLKPTPSHTHSPTTKPRPTPIPIPRPGPKQPPSALSHN